MMPRSKFRYITFSAHAQTLEPHLPQLLMHPNLRLVYELSPLRTGAGIRVSPLPPRLSALGSTDLNAQWGQQ